MSKYIKLEDAIHNINLEVIGRKEYTGDMKANLFFALDDLPTIEVSEDCISREQLKSLSYINKGNFNSVEGIRDWIDAAPSVIPKPKEGEWITKTVKKFCAPDCWYAGIFAIEGSWDEEEGSWLEEQDGFCSECGKQDEHYGVHKYCPNCGAKMFANE